MGLKNLLGGLLGGLIPLTSSHTVPGKVTANYDEFKDVTSITVQGQRVGEQPVLYGRDSFSGRKPKSDESPAIGFLMTYACPHPNFLADGKRVPPDKATETLPGMDYGFYPGPGIGYRYVYNYYDLPQIEQIATAKSVRYKVCNDVHTLKPQDQVYLQQFLAHFK